MVENRETWSRARELGLAVGRHAEQIFQSEDIELKLALDKALEGKVSKGDPDYDEVRKLAISHLKAVGLVKQPKAEPEKIVVEKPKVPEVLTRLKDLPEKHFQRIVDDAAKAEKFHPADALGFDEDNDN